MNMKRCGLYKIQASYKLANFTKNGYRQPKIIIMTTSQLAANSKLTGRSGSSNSQCNNTGYQSLPPSYQFVKIYKFYEERSTEENEENILVKESLPADTEKEVKEETEQK